MNDQPSPQPAVQPPQAAQPGLATRAVNAWLIWKLAILRLFLYCFTTDVGIYSTAMHSSKWSELSREDAFLMLLGIAAVNAGIWTAFLDKTIQNLEHGKVLPPAQDGSNTGSWQRATSTVTVAQSAGAGAPPPSPAAPPGGPGQ